MMTQEPCYSINITISSGGQEEGGGCVVLGREANKILLYFVITRAKNDKSRKSNEN
jgi:hypothetical protein